MARIFRRFRSCALGKLDYSGATISLVPIYLLLLLEPSVPTTAGIDTASIDLWQESLKCGVVEDWDEESEILSPNHTTSCDNFVTTLDQRTHFLAIYL